MGQTPHPGHGTRAVPRRANRATTDPAQVARTARPQTGRFTRTRRADSSRAVERPLSRRDCQHPECRSSPYVPRRAQVVAVDGPIRPDQVEFGRVTPAGVVTGYDIPIGNGRPGLRPGRTGPLVNGGHRTAGKRPRHAGVARSGCGSGCPPDVGSAAGRQSGCMPGAHSHHLDDGLFSWSGCGRSISRTGRTNREKVDRNHRCHADRDYTLIV